MGFGIGLLLGRRGVPPWVDTAAMVFAAVISSVFLAAVVWCVYLLVRYAVAFAKSARQARLAFAAADAAGRVRAAERGGQMVDSTPPYSGG